MGLPLRPQGRGIWSLRPLQVGPAEMLGFRPVSDAEPALGSRSDRSDWNPDPMYRLRNPGQVTPSLSLSFPICEAVMIHHWAGS